MVWCWLRCGVPNCQNCLGTNRNAVSPPGNLQLPIKHKTYSGTLAQQATSPQRTANQGQQTTSINDALGTVCSVEELLQWISSHEPLLHCFGEVSTTLFVVAATLTTHTGTAVINSSTRPPIYSSTLLLLLGCTWQDAIKRYRGLRGGGSSRLPRTSGDAGRRCTASLVRSTSFSVSSVLGKRLCSSTCPPL